MAVSGIIPSNTIISGTQISEILEHVKTLGVTADADATADDIAVNKTAYVNSQKLFGQVPEQSEVKMSLLNNRIVFSASKDIYRENTFNYLEVYRDDTTIYPTTSIITLHTSDKYLKAISKLIPLKH